MNWQEYNTLLIPLIQKFGSYHYPADKIKSGYFHWKHKSKDELLSKVNDAISCGVALELVSVINNSSNPSRNIYKHDEINEISDGFLENYLKHHGVSSVVELLKKSVEK